MSAAEAAPQRATRAAPRLEGVEGLRALAALSVVIYHCGQVTSSRTLGAGWLATLTTPFASGVTFFFVLSGFLLYRPFVAAFASQGQIPSIRSYLRSRFLRIFPAYWAVLLLVILVLGTPVVQVASPQLITGEGLGLGTALADAALVQTFFPATFGTGVLPAWSLSVEVSFYLVLPAVILLVAWFRARRPTTDVRALTLFPPLALVAIALVGKAVAVYVIPGRPAGFDEGWHSVLAFSLATRADAFACGMLAAVLLLRIERGLALPRRRIRLWVEAALVPLALAFFVFGGPLGRYAQSTLLAGLFAAAILWVVLAAQREGARRSVLVTFLTSRPMLLLGLCSYSIFLWNHPLLYWLDERGLTAIGVGGFFLAMCTLALPLLGLSYLTYRWVELPALRLKSGFRNYKLRPLRTARAESGPTS